MEVAEVDAGPVPPVAGLVSVPARRLRPARSTVELTAFVVLALAATLPFVFATPTGFVGVPGAVAALVSVSASIRLGARSGVLVAFLAGVTFVVLNGVAHDDLSLSERGTYAIPVWMAAAAVAGRAADRSRRRLHVLLAQLIGERQEAETARDALERVLASAPEIQREGTLADMAQAVCSASLEMFGGDSAALWDAGPEDVLTLVARVPPTPTLPLGMVTRIEDIDDLGEHIARRRVSFLADVEQSHPELWERYGRQANTRSVLRIPIAGDDSTRVLSITWGSRVDDPGAAIQGVAQRFADQAALALEHARGRELQAARAALHARLEAALLPRLTMADPSVTVSTRYEPGEERLLLGGDFLDAVELADGRIAALVGDVAGHGPDAAATGASLRAAWRALALAGLPLPALMRALNDALLSGRGSPELFVTLCTVAVGAARRSAEIVCAGHPAPMLLDTGARGVEVAPGPPLGVADDPHWSVAAVALPPAWSLLLYTDGLVEGRAQPGSAERFGAHRLLDRLGRTVTEAGSALDERALALLLDHVRGANGGNLSDDVAVLAISQAERASGAAEVSSG